MKLPVICACIILLFLFFPVHISAQDSGLEKSISINAKNKSISEVVKEISEKAQLHFSYSSQQIPVDRKVSVTAKDRMVKDILDQLLKSCSLEYSIVEKQIILKPSPEFMVEEVSDDKLLLPEKYTISGYLKDKKTGEILIGASVFAKGTKYGTLTNSYGFFSLTIPGNTYEMFFSYVGYKYMSHVIELKNDTKLSIEMEPSSADLGEIVVIAEDIEKEIRENQLSEMKLTLKTLNSMTGFLGETDIIKSLQSVPGIKSYGDGSSLFYVRGGASDQNLILIDEAPIYNPSHLFGFFTAFSPDAIKDVSVYKGDFPASYGGRLSSVIDIKTKDGNMKNFSFSGNAGPFTSSLTLEGPIWKEHCSFIVSGRRSNLNWLQNYNKLFDISFYDLNAKLNFKINDNNRLFASFYNGADIFNRITSGSVRTYGISWDNLLGTLRWNYIINDRLFFNTTFYTSLYNYYLYISKYGNDYWNSSIENYTVKTDVSWFLNPKNTIRSGVHVNMHTSNPGNVHFIDIATQKSVPYISPYQSLEYAFYACNENELTNKWSFRYGLRVPVWQNVGPTKLYNFDQNYRVQDINIIDGQVVYNTYLSFEPRINAIYKNNDRSTLKSSYTRTTQSLHQLSNSSSPFTSMEVWIPSGPNIRPSVADQFAAGWFRHFVSTGTDISCEPYFKYTYRDIDYKDHANLLFNPLIEGELRFGKTTSYGVELMVRRQEGRFTGWVGYTWSRAFRQTEGINNNMKYPANYDRPHNFCINLSYNNEKRWVATANWVYLSGAAFSTPTGFYYYNGYTIPVYGSKNNDRLPDYHRLDLSVTFNLNKPGARFRHNFTFTIYNLYFRDNPIAANFNKIIDDNGNIVVPSDMGNPELVPTTISVAGIIPSLTYNFKF